MATLDALRSLPVSHRPQRLLGCEVWRGLEWLSDADPAKVTHDVSARPHLAAALSGVFDSQIAGGKRYDVAVEGRRRANATFGSNTHAVDDATHVQYAVDMTELLQPQNDKMTLQDYCRQRLQYVQQDVLGQLDTLTKG